MGCMKDFWDGASLKQVYGQDLIAFRDIARSPRSGPGRGRAPYKSGKMARLRGEVFTAFGRDRDGHR